MTDEQGMCARIASLIAGHGYEPPAVEYAPEQGAQPFRAVVWEHDVEKAARGTWVGICAYGETCAEALCALKAEIEKEFTDRPVPA